MDKLTLPHASKDVFDSDMLLLYVCFVFRSVLYFLDMVLCGFCGFDGKFLDIFLQTIPGDRFPLHFLNESRCWDYWDQHFFND